MNKYSIKFFEDIELSSWASSNLTFYNDVDEIESDLSKVTKYSVNEGVTFFPGNAFRTSTLVSIDIFEGCEIIGYNAFYCCAGLCRIKVPDSLVSFENQDYIPRLRGIITTSSNLENIKTMVPSLYTDKVQVEEVSTEIKAPDSTYPIKFNGDLLIFSEYSQGSPNTIEYFTGESGMLFWTEEGNPTYKTSKAASYSCILNYSMGIGNNEFSTVYMLTHITVGPEFYYPTLGSQLFQSATNLVEVKILDGITSLAGSDGVSSNGTFYYCSSLKDVYLTDSITYAGQREGGNPFSECTSLENIYVTPASAVDNMRDVVFNGYPELQPLIKAAPEPPVPVKYLIDVDSTRYVPVSHANATYLDELTVEGKSKTVTEKLLEKQDTLAAGSGVSIVDNVISVNLPTSLSKYVEEFVYSDLTTGTISISHGISTTEVIVSVFNDSKSVIIPDEVTIIDEDNILIDLSSFTEFTNPYKVVIIG